MTKKINSKNSRVALILSTLLLAIVFAFPSLSTASAKTLNIGEPGGTIYIDGDLGVGREVPTQKLDVAGHIKANHFYTGYDWATKSHGINLGVDGVMGGIGFYVDTTAHSASIYREAGTSNFYLGARSGQAARGITISSGGDVGIGLTSPTHNLHVAGPVKFDGVASGVTGTRDENLATVSYVNSHVSDEVAASGSVGSGTSGQTLRHDGVGWVSSSNIFNNGTNVGVGVTAPLQKLHVHDKVRATGFCIGTNCITSWPDPGLAGSGTTNYLSKWSNGSLANSSIYDNGSNVGIGTTSLVGLLNLYNSTGSVLRLTGSVNSSISGAIDMLEGAGSFGSTGSYGARIMYEGGDNKFYIQTGSQTSVNTRLTIVRDSGDVGIGVSSPSHKLHVAGPVKFDGVASGVTGTSDNDLATVAYVNGMAVGNGISGQTLRHNGTSWVANSNLYNNGTNVGIGKTTPTQKLDVVGNATFSGNVGIGVINTSEKLQVSGRVRSDGFCIGASCITAWPSAGLSGSGTTNYITKWYGGTLTNSIIYDNGTNVGIGVTTAYQKLQVGGNVRATGFCIGTSCISSWPSSGLTGTGEHNSLALWNGSYLTSSSVYMDAYGRIGIQTNSPAYTLHVNGNAYASAWNSGSDERFKTNVTNLDNILDSVTKLRPVSFDWDSASFPEMNFSDKTEYGFIAQEVEKEFPHLVRTDDDGYKSLMYDRFSALLLQAIKEQQDEIISLNERIDKLEALSN